jgi:hypothetical protein
VDMQPYCVTPFIPDVELTRMKRKIFNQIKEYFGTDGSFTFAGYHLVVPRIDVDEFSHSISVTAWTARAAEGGS